MVTYTTTMTHNSRFSTAHTAAHKNLFYSLSTLLSLLLGSL